MPTSPATRSTSSLCAATNDSRSASGSAVAADGATADPAAERVRHHDAYDVAVVLVYLRASRCPADARAARRTGGASRLPPPADAGAIERRCVARVALLRPAWRRAIEGERPRADHLAHTGRRPRRRHRGVLVARRAP